MANCQLPKLAGALQISTEECNAAIHTGTSTLLIAQGVQNAKETLKG